MALAASAEQSPEAAVAAEREVVLLKVSCNCGVACSSMVLSMIMLLCFGLMLNFMQMVPWRPHHLLCIKSAQHRLSCLRALPAAAAWSKLTSFKQWLQATAGGCYTLPSLLAGSCWLRRPAAPHSLGRGSPYFWREACQLELFAS